MICWLVFLPCVLGRRRAEEKNQANCDVGNHIGIIIDGHIGRLSNAIATAPLGRRRELALHHNVALSFILEVTLPAPNPHLRSLLSHQHPDTVD